MSELRFGTVLLDLATTGTVARTLLQEYMEGSAAGDDYLLYTLLAVGGEQSPTSLAQRMGVPLTTVSDRLKPTGGAKPRGTSEESARRTVGPLSADRRRLDGLPGGRAAGNRVAETVKVGRGGFVVPDHPDELWVPSFGGTDLWRIRPR